ncbi:epichloenin A synthetase [Epichloe bromicola]|uniref:Epichloenin A synthetase n=1 Tax=Epichloe bromicola TaxID=79588 RepID=A0ABQ0CW22_9HYPO
MQPTCIYIVGAQSTGKTTLVNALEASYDDGNLALDRPVIIREVARTVLSEYDFNAHDISTSAKRCSTIQTLILKAQCWHEENALRTGSWFISDRSGLDPIVYAERHVGPAFANEMMLMDEWKKHRDSLARSLIFVCEITSAWLVDDGVRLMPTDWEDWKDYHELFCSRLHDLGLDFRVIPSTMLNLQERVEYVWEEWNRSMREQLTT